MKGHDRWAAAGWLALASPLVLFVALAAVALVWSATPALVASQLGSPETRQAIVISLRTTLAATAVVGVFGTFFALAIHRSGPAFSSALELLITIPAILPPSVAGLALLMAFGRRG